MDNGWMFDTKYALPLIIVIGLTFMLFYIGVDKYFGFFVLVPLIVLAVSISNAAVIEATAAIYHGVTPSFAATYRQVLPRFWNIVAVFLLSLSVPAGALLATSFALWAAVDLAFGVDIPLVVLFLIFIPPIIVYFVGYWFVLPCIVLEDNAGILDAFAMGTNLVRGRKWQVATRLMIPGRLCLQLLVIVLVFQLIKLFTDMNILEWTMIVGIGMLVNSCRVLWTIDHTIHYFDLCYSDFEDC